MGAAMMAHMTKRLSQATQNVKRGGSAWQSLEAESARVVAMLTTMARPKRQSKTLPLRKSRR